MGLIMLCILFNYTILRDALSNVQGVSFRRVPEGGVENYSFLNIFLPNEAQAKAAHMALVEGGIDACFYWFDNNWHYYRKWEHLIHKKSLGKLSKEVLEQLPDYSQADFSESDHWMGRTISCLVKLNWTENEVKERAGKMVDLLTKVLS